MISKIISFLSWVSEQGIRPEYSMGKSKYIKLVNQLSVLVAVIVLLVNFIPYPAVPPLLRSVMLLTPVIMASTILINRLGYPKLAKVIFYLELNAYCLTLTLFVGSASGAHMFFIPVIFGSALVFDMRRRWQRMLVLLVPLLTISVLWLTGDRLVIIAAENAEVIRQAYVINYIVTILISFLLAFLYFRITNQQQRQLSDAIQQLEDLNVALKEKERSLESNLQYSDLLLENLKASKDYFKSVIQNASDIICVTGSKGFVKYLTPSFYRLTGYLQEDIRSMMIFDFVHPDDLAECQERFFRRVKDGGMGQTFMFRFRKANGDYIYLQANGSNLLGNQAVNGIVITARDITERVHYEQELIRKENNIRSILDNNPTAIWMVDSDFKLLDYNKAFINLLGMLHGIVPYRGMNLMQSVPEKEQQVWLTRVGVAGAGKMEEYLDNRYIAGREYTFRVWVHPIMKDGEADRFTVFAEDITIQKQAELALIDAKEKAEEATRIKTQFLSTMSHEIRTPMNAVIGMTHVLMHENPRPDQEENLRILRFSAENLLALINDVLDFNKIEAGKVVFENTPFDLPQLVSDLKNSMQATARDKGLLLEVLHDAELPKVVLGDPVRLSQVLANLLSNAVKFTSQGSVRIQTSLLKEEAGKCHIAFKVEDTGIGIAAEKQNLIFESFAQAEADTTRRFGGTGLGLAITKRLLELQGSHITVESTPGEGSVFSFVLPFEKLSQTTVPMHTIPIEPEDNLENVRILLVEDNPLNRFVAEKFLIRWGMQLDMAETGAEALELLQKHSYKLVLMDLQLPDIDGFEVVERLRASEFSNARIPVVAMSASVEPHVQAQAFASGMQDFVVKPFNPEELKQKIYSFIGAGLAQVGS
ncbi:PAS domain S-box protein [Cesiribacter sp. SM1]|uniref:PAS domain S-box protein n=1 Tax=Cesiribacter sp. SM1 TaxID=2861196 RepID=UPI001CD49880|nr:PAS domain S-box protein [Cesiribacter sp. SM1]